MTQEVDGGAVVVHAPVGAESTLKVAYWKEPQHLERHGVTFVSVKLHARIDGGQELIQEVGRETAGRFIRTPAAIELGADAKHLEYWFEVLTSAGETLWDSTWANNYWLAVAPPAVVGPVEVLYDAASQMA
jgi:hypothetical protein